MEWFSTESELVALGSQVAAVRREADDRCRSKGFFTSILFQSPENYDVCKYLNEHMSTYPDLICLKNEAEIAMARYADGKGAIDRAYRPLGATVQFLAGLTTGHLVSAGSGFWRLLKHGGAVAQYDESSSINKACSQILENYALVSVSPEGCALMKGKWWVFDYIRNSMLKCRAGAHLESIIEIDDEGEVFIVKDFRVD